MIPDASTDLSLAVYGLRELALAYTKSAPPTIQLEIGTFVNMTRLVKTTVHGELLQSLPFGKVYLV